jgi:hypothetical protein
MPRRARHPLPNPLFAEPVFGEGGQMLPDPTDFLQPHPSDTATYNAVKNLLKSDVVPFERSRLADEELFPLEQAAGSRGAEFVKAIRQQGRVVFHSMGDSGASESHRLHNELRVMDAISAEYQTLPVSDRPAFLYHLGDIVYNFGEAKYYYDQFYEPLRNYPRPVFAIPGNHDSFILPGTDQSDEPLAVFSRNFCATQPRVTVEAGSLHRTAMTQPGVYFTLDAPFVRIIGLFSNSLEDPGLISSEAGHWHGVPEFQLSYLRAQLTRVRDEHYAGAIILAVHHPPFSYSKPPHQGRADGGNHGGSPAMLREIDTICGQVGVYPHAVLSGHAHNYQRYTRTVRLAQSGQDYQVPFIVCGSGGHNVNTLIYHDFHHRQDPAPGADVSYLEENPALNSRGLVIDRFDDYNYGYLRVTVDAQRMGIRFNPTSNGGNLGPDDVTVDLASHQLV